MDARSDGGARASGHSLVVTRVIDAPPELVFSLWTTGEHLVHWWGPAGYTLPSCELDFRVGGAFRYRMRSATDDRWLRGVFHEIVPPSKLVFSFAWGDAEGTTGPESIVTVTFERQNERTKLTLRQTPFATEAEALDHEDGWTKTIDRLIGYVPSSERGG